MQNNYYKIDIVYGSEVYEGSDGHEYTKEAIITAIGKNQKIYQSRIDSSTEYTMKLKHRFKISVQGNSEQLENLNLANYSLLKARVYQSTKIREYAILSLQPLQYNQYILELGSAN